MRKIAQIRCPYLAIPVPGERPFVIERSKFDAVVRGVQVDTMKLEKGRTVDPKHGEIWRLILVYHRGRLAGRTVLYNLLQTTYASAPQYREFRTGINKWAERERTRRTLPAQNPSQERHLKQIHKLERELKRLVAHRPVHPIFNKTFYDGRYHLERLANEREARRRYALLANSVLKSRAMSTKVYGLLGDLGKPFCRYSQLTVATRRRFGIYSEEEYWKKLYLVMGCEQRYKESPRDFDQELSEHRAALVQYVQTKREIDSIRSQIEALQAIVSTVVPLVNDNGSMIAA